MSSITELYYWNCTKNLYNNTKKMAMAESTARYIALIMRSATEIGQISSELEAFAEGKKGKKPFGPEEARSAISRVSRCVSDIRTAISVLVVLLRSRESARKLQRIEQEVTRAERRIQNPDNVLYRRRACADALKKSAIKIDREAANGWPGEVLG